MQSLWRKTVSLPACPPLTRDTSADVLVVGGGLTGLLCAWSLRRAGADVLLLESDRLCGGTTGNTTAKVTVQHGLLYGKLLRTRGPEAARQYLQANQRALERYRALCRGLDCDFETADSFVYALEDRAALEREAAALQTLGAPAELVSHVPLPLETAGAVRLPDQAQVHPLKLAAALLEGLRIHEGTRVLKIRPGAADTTGGTVRARHIVAATHFPMVNSHGAYFLKLYQARSYVLALEGVPEAERPRGIYVDGIPGGLSFRRWGDLLLLGGGGHRTGKQGGGWAELEAFAAAHWPRAKAAGRWAAQDCMTLDGVPYIGRYSRSTPGLFVATGFNKWGMTSAMAAAELLTDLILGREAPYEALFSPSRGMLHPQLAANGFEAVKNLAAPTVPRCPHMGCALKQNRQEDTWDCPCHGSRFGSDGRLLEGPAQRGLHRRTR